MAERRVGIKVSAEGARAAAAELKKVQQALAALGKASGVSNIVSAGNAAAASLKSVATSSSDVAASLSNIAPGALTQLTSEAAAAAAAQQSVAASTQSVAAGLVNSSSAAATTAAEVETISKSFTGLAAIEDDVRRLTDSATEAELREEAALQGLAAATAVRAAKLQELTDDLGRFVVFMRNASAGSREQAVAEQAAKEATAKASIAAKEAARTQDAVAAATKRANAARAAGAKVAAAQAAAGASETKQAAEGVRELGAAAKTTSSEVVNVTEGVGGLNAIAAVIDPRLGQLASVLGAVKIAGSEGAVALKTLATSLKATIVSLLNPAFIAAAAVIAAIVIAYKAWTAGTEAQKKALDAQNKSLQETIDKTDKLNKSRQTGVTVDQQLLADAGRSARSRDVRDFNIKAAAVSSLGLVPLPEAKKRLLEESPAGGPLQVTKAIQRLGRERLKRRKINAAVSRARARGVPEKELATLRSSLEGATLLTGNRAVDRRLQAEADKITGDLADTEGGVLRRRQFRRVVEKNAAAIASDRAQRRARLTRLEEQHKKLPAHLPPISPLTLPLDERERVIARMQADVARFHRLDAEIAQEKQRIDAEDSALRETKRRSALVINNSTVFFGAKSVGANTPTPPGQVQIP